MTAEASKLEVPAHVAIIMDGNGRWARARGLPRTLGHRQGAEAVRRSVTAAIDLGIPYLTLFGFSSENWRRPVTEVEDLMGLLRRYLKAEIAELHKNGIRLRVVGERERLPKDIAKQIDEAEKLTREGDRLNFTIALSYGGRQEILAAARRLAKAAAAGEIDPDDIDVRPLREGTADPWASRPGFDYSHERRAAHQQFPAVAVGLQRIHVHREILARFRQGRSGGRHRGVPAARSAVWRFRRDALKQRSAYWVSVFFGHSYWRRLCWRPFISGRPTAICWRPWPLPSCSGNGPACPTEVSLTLPAMGRSSPALIAVALAALGSFDLAAWVLAVGVMAALVLSMSGPRERSLWLAFGVCYLGAACISFQWLRQDNESGRNVIYWLSGAGLGNRYRSLLCRPGYRRT